MRKKIDLSNASKKIANREIKNWSEHVFELLKTRIQGRPLLPPKQRRKTCGIRRVFAHATTIKMKHRVWRREVNITVIIVIAHKSNCNRRHQQSACELMCVCVCLCPLTRLLVRFDWQNEMNMHAIDMLQQQLKGLDVQNCNSRAIRYTRVMAYINFLPFAQSNGFKAMWRRVHFSTTATIIKQAINVQSFCVMMRFFVNSLESQWKRFQLTQRQFCINDCIWKMERK